MKENPMSGEQTWISCDDSLPDKYVAVETKIDDERGVRNVQVLKRGGANGRLWFFADESMYVYYTPTHWRPKVTD